MEQMESLQKGASYPAVTDGDVRAQVIPVPPLAEQQRSVGVLDEAFAGLATAQANGREETVRVCEDALPGARPVAVRLPAGALPVPLPMQGEGETGR